MTLDVVRYVSPAEMKEWRTKAAQRAAAGEGQYAATAGTVRPGTAPVTMTGNTTGEVEVEARGKPRAALDVIDLLMARRIAGVTRLMSKDPEAKRHLVEHLRLTRPGLFGTMTDDEAMIRFDEIVRAEAEEATRNAMIHFGRAKVRLGPGGW